MEAPRKVKISTSGQIKIPTAMFRELDQPNYFTAELIQGKLILTPLVAESDAAINEEHIKRVIERAEASGSITKETIEQITSLIYNYTSDYENSKLNINNQE